MEKGWIKLHRKIVHHELWNDVTTFRLFMFLLINATHQETSINGVKLNRGQYLRSYSKLADDLAYKEGRGLKKVSKSTVYKSVKKLVDNDMVIVRDTELGTAFTIVNYEYYQGFGDGDGGNERTVDETNDERSGNEVETKSERTANHNKNVKNLKNDKKYEDDDKGSIFSEEFDRLFVQTFHQEPSPKQIEILLSLMDDGLKLDLLEWALEETNLRMGHWGYFHKILSNCLNDKIFTREQALLASERRREKRKGNVTPLRRVDHAITQPSDYVTNEYDWESFTVRG